MAAVLVDNLTSLDHSVRRKFKKIFAQLNENYIVRTPIKNSQHLADLIIEGPENSWLMVGCHQVKPTAHELKKYLNFSASLNRIDDGKITYMAVTEIGDSLFDGDDKPLNNVINIEREELFDNGVELISQNMSMVSKNAYDWLKQTIFPESKIHPACTTRRNILQRDNTAKLQAFFLNYDQESATKLDMFDDLSSIDEDADRYFVRLINGVAGCGKTLILINRAILYCKKYPDRKALLLIHNKPITSDIEYKFAKYLDGQPSNLKIQTFHAFARSQQIAHAGKTKLLFSARDLATLVKPIMAGNNVIRSELNFSNDQIWSEIEYINEFLIADKATYLVVDRLGRGFAIQRPQRELIWKLYEKAMLLLSSRTKGYLPSLYIRELCLAENIENELNRYDHILLDEAQFFFPSWLQLVTRSLNKNGQLFMCADPNQGFLKSRLSWQSVGLNVRGRTRKLNYSYRTTYEILISANALLEHLNEDSEDFVKPDFKNMMHGSKPQVIYSDTPQDELKRFLNEIKEIARKDDVQLHHIMVLCSENIRAANIKRIIENELGKGMVVNCNDPRDLEENLGNKIRVMSINSCTGMESSIIFVLGVGNLLNSENNIDLSDEERIVLHQESTRKLYVAMTRAGQKLVLFSTKKLPEYLEKFIDVT